MFIRRAGAALLPGSRRLFTTAPYNTSNDLSRTIAEFNKEMESIFGEPPPTGSFGSTSDGSVTQYEGNGLDWQGKENVVDGANKSNMFGLTHVGSTGEAQMVDVSLKKDSKRMAIACCRVILGKKVFDMVLANQVAKGDVLTVAKVAGINGAKHTSSLIPLCHNIMLSHVHVDLRLNADDCSVDIKGEASSTGKTGVEMEALTAVTVAGLTVYDMCKAASKEIRITDVLLESKTGGKSGDWSRED